MRVSVDPAAWAVAPPRDAVGPALAAAASALAASAPDRVVHLVVDGGPDHTLAAGRRQAGRVGTADASVHLAQATLVQLLAGTTSLDAAFQAGAVRCDDLRLLAKLGAALSQGADASPAGPTPAGDGAGRALGGGVHLVTSDEVAAFCEVTGDDSPLWFGPGAEAPPMFHARLVRDLLFEIMESDDLCGDLDRVLHAGHALTVHRLLRAGEVVHTRGEVLSVEDKATGRLSTCRLCLVAGGEVVQEATTTFFLRRDTAPLPPGPAAAPAPADALSADALSADVPVPADLAARYALASGDDNPLHVDAAAAQRAGFAAPILHGLCTLSLGVRALLAVMEARAFSQGDPRRVRGISARFTAPVPLDTTLRFRGTTDADGLSFDAVRLEDGQPATQVLSHGRLQLAADHR